jgi:hypothetical protein
MATNKEPVQESGNYKEWIKKKLDEIIERTNAENAALKKILESLQNDETINNDKQNK